MSERVSDEYLARIIEQGAGVNLMHLAADLRDARRERDAERAKVARLREALQTAIFANGCPGIEIGDGNYSGCNAQATGATDCPVCGVLAETGEDK